jgi:phospholipase/lecithinase/hemolysin
LETLLAGLEASLQVQIVRLDTFALLDEIVAAPASFGLTDVSHPCIALNTTVHPYCAKPGGYLFWDGIHPTVAGHHLVAERAYKALNPGSHP